MKRLLQNASALVRRARRGRWFASEFAVLVAVAFGLVVAAAALAGFQQTDHPVETLDIVALPRDLRIDAPVRVSSDVALPVTVRWAPARTTAAAAARKASKLSYTEAPPPDGTDVVLEVRGALMTSVLHAPMVNGRAQFTVSPDLLADTGVAILIAHAKSGSGSSAAARTESGFGSSVGVAHIDVVPRRAVDGVIPLAGPRSIVADTKHWTMVSVIPTESFDNGLPDNTEIKLHVRRPDGQQTEFTGKLSGLLTGVRVYSGTKAGLTTIRVEVMGATGPEIQVREVPGPPVPYTLQVSDGTFIADARSLVEVRTPQLVDQYRNVLDDGTFCSMEGLGPDGPVRVTGSTIDGRCILRLRSPSRPGTVLLSAWVLGTQSKPLEIPFGRDVEQFSAQTKRVGTLVDVTVGPIRSDLGGFAPDGTTVGVVIAGRPEQFLQVRDGQAHGTAEAVRGSTMLITALGRTIEVTAP